MKKSGFTLIELVLVIVLLGVLAVTALPKFVDIQDDAHNEVTRATMGAFRAGVQMLRLKWQTNGQPSSLTINGTLFNFTSEGWAEKPTDDADGCMVLWNTVLESPPNIETFSQTLAISDWSALYLTAFGVNECFFYNHHGEVWVNATTDMFSYYPEPVAGNPAGTIIGWNLD